MHVVCVCMCVLMHDNADQRLNVAVEHLIDGANMSEALALIV